MTANLVWARQTGQSLSCTWGNNAGSIIADILIGVSYSIADNLILQTTGFIAELTGTKSSTVRNWKTEIENWVIEKGVTNKEHFYLSQIIGDVIQTVAAEVLAVKNLPKGI